MLAGAVRGGALGAGEEEAWKRRLTGGAEGGGVGLTGGAAGFATGGLGEGVAEGDGCVEAEVFKESKREDAEGGWWASRLSWDVDGASVA